MIACPKCRRPNGPRPRCLYCGEPLPVVEDAGAVGPAGDSPDAEARLRTGLDPRTLSRLPEGLRRSLQGPAARPRPGPPPREPDTREHAATLPTMADRVRFLLARRRERLESGEKGPVLLGPGGDTDGAMNALADPAAATANRQSGARPETASAVPDLLKGRGHFGRRRAAARLLLVPDPAYAKSLPWLKVRLGETVGLDAYTATRALQRDVPVLLKEYADPEEAREKSMRLLERGLRTRVLTPEVALAYARPVPVTGCRLGLHRVLLEVQGGEPREVRAGDVARVVLGEIRPPAGGPTAREVKGPLLTRQTVIETRSLDAIQTPYWLLDIHLIQGPPVLRARADTFDYHCLGPDRGISAWANFNAVLDRLRAVLGDFPVDKAFRKVAHPGERDVPEADGGGPPAVPEEVAFTEYGMLLDLCGRGTPAAAETGDPP